MRFTLSAYALFLPFLSCWIVSAKTVYHDASFIPDRVLRVTQHHIRQSCLPSKSNVLINETSPGPELRLLEGKTYWIRVYNDMKENNLTMHWHGLTMAASPFSDGTPQGSQWPIPPHHFFDYEINVPVGMAGSYMYHSHVGFQAVSASGPLIVDDLKVPYHYDHEKIIFLQDTFVKNFTTIEQGLTATPFIWSGEAAAILVNGKGGGSSNGTACNASLSTIDVEPGKTYRLRFISATALTFASLAIEDHSSLEIIEADGSYTEKLNTSFLQISSGERYSVLLHTKKKPLKSTYYIQLESRERPTLTRGFAILNYGPKATKPLFPPSSLPLTLPNTVLGFLDYNLRPLKPSPDFPSACEVTRTLTITVHQAMNGTIVWLENSYNWTEAFPREPYLVSLYKNDSVEFPSMQRALANNGIDPVTRVFPAQIGEVLEIVIQNTGSFSNGLDAHAFHFHGRHYWNLGSGNGTYDPTANDARWAGHQPTLRDTTMLYRYGITTGNGTVQGWRVWRLRVTEPGVWMLHCHYLQHMAMGMQAIVLMGNETELLDKVPRPEVQGYLTYGGDVYGNISHHPTMIHYQSP